jgi:predicted permease
MTPLVHALRRLRARPGITAASVVMLACAVGLATAMYAAVDALVLRPVPFAAPDRLAYLGTAYEHGGSYLVPTPVFDAWRASGAFDGLASAVTGTALVEARGGELQARATAWVTPDLFAVLGGVRPLQGRLFEATEGRAGADDRVLVSETLWRAAYGGDPALVGRRIRVGDADAIVVGILPAAFRFPTWDTVLWRPIDYAAPPPAHARAQPIPVARFGGRPRADALAIATRIAREVDGTLAGHVAAARPLSAAHAYDRRAITMLGAASALIFAILCLNVAALRMVELRRRRRDVAVSLALGAPRARILREAALDGLLVGTAGLACGAGLGWALLAIARAFLPPALVPSLNPLEVDLRALAVMSALGLLATTVTTVWPAWRASRVDTLEALGTVARATTASRASRSVARVLLTAEMALACLLLASAGLLVRTFVNLRHADRGLETAGVLTVTMFLPRESFADAPARRAAVAAMDARVRSLPGVQALAWSSGVPPRGGGTTFGSIAGEGPGGTKIDGEVSRYNVDGSFFELYQLPFVRGRTFAAGEGPEVAIVGEDLARRLWPGSDPVGQTLVLNEERVQVVGVTRELRYPSVDRSLDRPEIYQPYGGPGPYATLSLRCDAGCPSLALLRERLLAASPAVNVWKAERLADVYLAELARPRAVATLGAGFAGLAAAAAVGGLFCLLTLAVGERRRELGIRAAMGATPAGLARLVLAEGLGIALVGLALGCAAAVGLGRVGSALYYGVTGSDPLTWVAVVGGLCSLAVVACLRPVREAMRVDPVQLLRHE